jgi:hypothetical protein
LTTSRFYYVGIKFLILTCTEADIRAGVAKTVLNSVGSPYDVIVQATWGTQSLSLINSDNTGKYAAIVAATELACWSKTQQTEIEYYELNFHSKTVILYSWPYSTNGVVLSSVGSVILNNVIATFADAMLPSVPFYNANTQISISGVTGFVLLFFLSLSSFLFLNAAFRYPSNIGNQDMAVPAIYGDIGGNKYVLAAFITYSDTRRRLEFYFDQVSSLSLSL